MEFVRPSGVPQIPIEKIVYYASPVCQNLIFDFRTVYKGNPIVVAFEHGFWKIGVGLAFCETKSGLLFGVPRVIRIHQCKKCNTPRALLLQAVFR